MGKPMKSFLRRKLFYPQTRQYKTLPHNKRIPVTKKSTVNTTTLLPKNPRYFIKSPVLMLEQLRKII
jgi:hypothetical protein